ncbi:hypothetical protein KEJ26_07265 [Candidatus Bathyarchaeota archaeon]|nr:hypothetical protein [Candidatus Bathyarchaeota archaeon]
MPYENVFISCSKNETVKIGIRLMKKPVTHKVGNNHFARRLAFKFEKARGRTKYGKTITKKRGPIRAPHKRKGFWRFFQYYQIKGKKARRRIP